MARRWETLHPAASGIDWTNRLHTARFDPGLAWLETINFAARGVAPGNGIPVSLELASGGGPLLRQLHDEGLLWTPPIWRDAADTLRYCTALVSPASMLKLPEQILRIEHGLIANPRSPGTAVARPRPAPTREDDDVPAAARRIGTSGNGPSRNVIAVIDVGCAFAHPQFRKRDASGKPVTRVTRLWDQGRSSSPAPWRVPAAFGYGMEADEAGLQQWMCNLSPDDTPTTEAVCYASAELELPANGVGWHGTHVMDLACGLVDPMSPASQADAAADADILFVQLPPRAVPNHGGGWLKLHVLNALRYILHHTDKSDKVVVNLSFGAHGGPHDGSMLIELAIDDLIKTERPTNFAVVVAAGNSFDRNGHAELNLPPGATRSLEWLLPPDNSNDSFLEIWLPAQGGHDVEIQVTPPNGIATGFQAPGTAISYNIGDPVAAVAMLLFVKQAPAGRGDLLAYVAVAPTARVDEYPQPASADRWRIDLRNNGKTNTVVNAWIERAALQSVFVGKHIATTGTLSSVACGRESIVVGGLTQHAANPPVYAAYSSAGPARTTGGRLGPDVAAPADRFDNATGKAVPLQCAGPLSSRPAKFNGTSAAAPQVARRVLNIFAAATEKLTRIEILDRLLPGADLPGNNEPGRRGRPI